MRLLLLLPFLISTALAQTTGEIQGFIFDVVSGETIPGVNIVLVGTDWGVSSDLDGFYRVVGLPDGAYTVVASFIGFEDAVVENVIVVAGSPAVVHFRLEDDPSFSESHMWYHCWGIPLLFRDPFAARYVVGGEGTCAGDIGLELLPIDR